jgi:hypothetical protein
MPNIDPTAVIVPRSAALAAERLRAERWANLSGDLRFVIEIDTHFQCACYQDLRTYYAADILAGRITIAYVAQPGPPAVAEPDVSFTALGWAD